MPGNLRKLLAEVPRPLEIMARDGAKETPIGTRRLSDREQMTRLEPLMGLIASGDVPLDDTSAKAVAAYLGSFHKRAR